MYYYCSADCCLYRVALFINGYTEEHQNLNVSMVPILVIEPIIRSDG